MPTKQSKPKLCADPKAAEFKSALKKIAADRKFSVPPDADINRLFKSAIDLGNYPRKTPIENMLPGAKVSYLVARTFAWDCGGALAGRDDGKLFLIWHEELKLEVPLVDLTLVG